MRARTIGFTLALVAGLAWTPGEAGTTAGGGSCPGDQLAQILSSVPYVEVSVGAEHEPDHSILTADQVAAFLLGDGVDGRGQVNPIVDGSAHKASPS